MPHPDFDGHPARDFAAMTPEERLDNLSAKIALVWELRRARQESTIHTQGSEAPRKGS